MKRNILFIAVLCALVSPVFGATMRAKLSNIKDAEQALKLYQTDASTNQLKREFFESIFFSFPWEVLTSAQQQRLKKYWQDLPADSRKAVEKKGEAHEQVATSIVLMETAKTHPHHHRPHHKPHPPVNVPPPGSEQDIKKGEFDTKHSHAKPSSGIASQPALPKPPVHKVPVVPAHKKNLYGRVGRRDVVYAPADGDASEVQISTKSPINITDKVSSPQKIGLIDGFPAIGVYGTPYVFRTRLALIELGPQQLVKIPDAIAQQLTNKKVDLHVVINGLLHGGKTDRVNNLVYHGWTAKLEGTDRFSVNVPMGIFMANGVKAAPAESVAFDRLQGSNVNPHDPLDLSPNNARFEIIEGRNVATFWSIAQYKDAATVTFHVILNNQDMVDVLRVCLDHAYNNDDVTYWLGTLAKSANGPDKVAIEKAVATINQLLR